MDSRVLGVLGLVLALVASGSACSGKDVAETAEKGKKGHDCESKRLEDYTCCFNPHSADQRFNCFYLNDTAPLSHRAPSAAPKLPNWKVKP